MKARWGWLAPREFFAGCHWSAHHSPNFKQRKHFLLFCLQVNKRHYEKRMIYMPHLTPDAREWLGWARVSVSIFMCECEVNSVSMHRYTADRTRRGMGSNCLVTIERRAKLHPFKEHCRSRLFFSNTCNEGQRLHEGSCTTRFCLGNASSHRQCITKHSWTGTRVSTATAEETDRMGVQLADRDYRALTVQKRTLPTSLTTRLASRKMRMSTDFCCAKTLWKHLGKVSLQTGRDHTSTWGTRKIATDVEWLRVSENYVWRSTPPPSNLVAKCWPHSKPRNNSQSHTAIPVFRQSLVSREAARPGETQRPRIIRWLRGWNPPSMETVTWHVITHLSESLIINGVAQIFARTGLCFAICRFW